MKWIASAISVVFTCCEVMGQEPSSTMEQQLEDLTEMMEDSEVSDDSWWQHGETLARNPLNLNVAGEGDLKELLILTPIQIAAFLDYRRLLGKLISLYELQAIPGWDIATIEKLLPFVTVSSRSSLKENVYDKLRNGEHQIIARYSKQLKRSAGYRAPDSGRSYYAGDPSRMLLRYRYQHKNTLQYGATATKDAGEPFFKYPNQYGFDSYSFHYFSRHNGLIKTVALGDYTINLGQGLIHWQSLAFGKGNAVLNVKRQAQVLRPYTAAGYFFFNRGGAITLRKNKWESTLFTSVRALDSNIEEDDTGAAVVTSIKTSGYRRTPAEIADKHSLRHFSWGASIHYQQPRLKVGFNTIHHYFDKPIQREERLYNLHAIAGNQWSNYSVDYSWTYRNVHLFGETALDRNGSIATLNSVMASVHSKVDLVVLHRYIQSAYQAMQGNAFTVNTNPTNEKGTYVGISLKPHKAFQLNAYADIYRFPWLRYRTDAPSGGADYFVQLNYKPDKQTELYSRFRSRYNPLNYNDGENALYIVRNFSHRSWRTQISYRINSNITIRHRFEMLWYQQTNTKKEKGFLAFFDFFYKPVGRSFSFNTRVQYFDSDSYNSRLYAYENDVLYYYATPVFYDRGSRYYLNAQYRLGRHIRLWLKWGQTIYANRSSIGSGLDRIDGNKRPEVRVLLSARF